MFIKAFYMIILISIDILIRSKCFSPMVATTKRSGVFQHSLTMVNEVILNTHILIFHISLPDFSTPYFHRGRLCNHSFQINGLKLYFHILISLNLCKNSLGPFSRSRFHLWSQSLSGLSLKCIHMEVQL